MELFPLRSTRLATTARRTSTSLSPSIEVSNEAYGSPVPARLSATTASLRVSGFLSFSARSKMFRDSSATFAEGVWQKATAATVAANRNLFIWISV